MDSEALRRAGITADTEIPGGHIARDAQGEPTGYAEEAAFMRAAAQVGAPSQTQRLARLDAAQREYLRHGIRLRRRVWRGVRTWRCWTRRRVRVDSSWTW